MPRRESLAALGTQFLIGPCFPVAAAPPRVQTSFRGNSRAAGTPHPVLQRLAHDGEVIGLREPTLSRRKDGLERRHWRWT